MTRFDHSVQVLPQINTIVDARYFAANFSALNYLHSNNQNTSTYLPTSNDAPTWLLAPRNRSHLAIPPVCISYNSRTTTDWGVLELRGRVKTTEVNWEQPENNTYPRSSSNPERPYPSLSGGSPHTGTGEQNIESIIQSIVYAGMGMWILAGNNTGRNQNKIHSA